MKVRWVEKTSRLKGIKEVVNSSALSLPEFTSTSGFSRLVALKNERSLYTCGAPVFFAPRESERERERAIGGEKERIYSRFSRSCS